LLVEPLTLLLSQSSCSLLHVFFLSLVPFDVFFEALFPLVFFSLDSLDFMFSFSYFDFELGLDFEPFFDMLLDCKF
jgi:hypothetical protein